MQVHGIDITHAQQSAIRLAMTGTFRAQDLEQVAVAAGVPVQVGRGIHAQPVAMRTVDRLIQIERKAGHLIRQGHTWTGAPLAVEREPDTMDMSPREPCCFCRASTPYWCIAKDVAVCLTCASTHSIAQVPSKAAWFAAEAARQAV